MITGNAKVWFLSRPRRFGKSLTVSTLASFFSGEKGLFQGLAIEKHRTEKRFASSPVITLDMNERGENRRRPG
jgi:hypothetical protein